MPPDGMPAKKTSPIVWILVAFGGVFLLGVILVVGLIFFGLHKIRQAGVDPALMRSNPALAMTKIFAATNPNLEVVTVDERGQNITVRDKKSGKTFHISFNDAQRGKFEMHEDGKDGVSVSSGNGSVEVKSADGDVKYGGGEAKVPTWIPDYPGSQPQGMFSAQSKDGHTGSFTFKTKDSADKVARFYEDGLKSSGLKVTTTSTNAGGAGFSGVTAEDEDKAHTIHVTIIAQPGESSVTVTYQAKK